MSETQSPVRLINKITVTGDVDEFERIARSVTEYMSTQPGYISSQLLRSVNDPRVFVEMASWDTADAHRSAVTSAGFRERVRPLGAVASVEPDVYSVIREAGGDE